MQSMIISWGHRIYDYWSNLLLAIYQSSITGQFFLSLKQTYHNGVVSSLLNGDYARHSRSYRLLSSIMSFIQDHLRLPARWQNKQLEILLAAVTVLIAMTALSFYQQPMEQAGVFLAAMLLAGITFYRTEYGLYSAALLLPFLPQKALFGLAMLCLCSMLWHMTAKGKTRLHMTPVFVPLLLFYLVMFVATVTSVSFWDSVSEFVIPVIGLLFLLVIVNTIDSKDKLDNLLLTMVVAGLITASYAVYQFHAGVIATEVNKAWVDLVENPTVMNRAYAVFENPNLLAQYTILISMLSIGTLLSVKRFSYQLLCSATVVVAAYCLLLTYSRGGWLAFVGALLILALFKNKALASIVLAAAAGVYTMLPLSITSRLATITSTKDTSNLYRLDTWSSTLEVIKNHWETGVGLGRRAFSRVFYTHMINSNTVPHSHNLYLQLISEFGILGLAIFCWLFIVILRIGLKLSSLRDTWARSITAGVMGAFAGFFIHSMVDYFLWYYKIAIFIWLLVAIVLVLERIALKNKDNERNESVAKAAG